MAVVQSVVCLILLGLWTHAYGFDCANPPPEYYGGPEHYYHLLSPRSDSEARADCEADGARLAFGLTQDDYRFMQFIGSKDHSRSLNIVAMAVVHSVVCLILLGLWTRQNGAVHRVNGSHSCTIQGTLF